MLFERRCGQSRDQIASVQFSTDCCGFWFSLFATLCIDFDFPISQTGVQGLGRAGVTQWIDILVRFWEEVRVADLLAVQFVIVDTELEEAILPQQEDNCAGSFCCERLDDFFLNHPVDYSRLKLSRRWPSPVWCTVRWADVFFSKFRSVSCCRIASNMFVSHVREFVEKVQKFWTMLFALIGNEYFVLPVVVKAVIAGFLDCLVFLYLSDMN